MRAFLTALVLLLTIVPTIGADAPSPSTHARRVIDLAFLTRQQAIAEEGHRILFRVDLDSLPGDAGTHIVYDCASPDQVHRTLWVRPGQTVAPVMAVEAELRLLWHHRSKDGVFEGFFEYRLMDAVRIE